MGDDKELANRMVAKLQQARLELESLMARHGLSPQEGWRIHEQLVNTDTGTAFVLRPVHRVQTPPTTLEVYIPVES
jgi:hypothetical protein